MTDTNVCEMTVPPNDESRRSSIQVGSISSSRRSSKASIASVDQDLTSLISKGSMNPLPIFDARILGNIDPLDLKKLEMMNEVYSEDEQEIEENYDSDEETETHQQTNSVKDLNNNDYIPDNLSNADLLKEIDGNVIIELKEAFELFDINGDGLITHSDLKKTFISLGLDVPDDEITKMLDEGSKPLDEEGFVKMIGANTIQLDPDNIMTEALSKWDRDASGLIPFTKFRGDLMAAGDRFTEQEAEIALEEAPVVVVKGRKMIDYKEFSQDICCIRKKKTTNE